MTNEATLGGYLREHSCPPSFQGRDGLSYSVEAFVDETPNDDGRYGAALLFVRWSPENNKPNGHLETPFLTYENTPSSALESVKRLTLHELKDHLDRLVANQKENSDW